MNSSMNLLRLPIVLEVGGKLHAAETYGFSGSQGVVLEGQLVRPKKDSSSLFILMHPTSSLHLLPLSSALASRGHHVLCANSRYPKNDSSLIIEKVVADLGSWVNWARGQGYDHIVLIGWSGGGSLALMYQAEAEDPTIVSTPAGEPIDLGAAGLTPADGLILVAAHLSRAETLTEWMDPSVLDESDPSRRDPHFDIYSDSARHVPPYSLDFITEFRDAQRHRNHRITRWVWENLDNLRDLGEPDLERPFIVHRTMCDVRWLDVSIEPNDRAPGWCYLGDPRQVNAGPVGLARYTTLRSWLSQWSLADSRAIGARNAVRVRRAPVLQIENSADDAVPATHSRVVRAALGSTDKAYSLIRGATHYYKGQPELLAECIDTIEAWCLARAFIQP